MNTTITVEQSKLNPSPSGINQLAHGGVPWASSPSVKAQKSLNLAAAANASLPQVLLAGDREVPHIHALLHIGPRIFNRV